MAYNYVANWHDGIDIATYGTPDGAPNDIADRVPMDIDFYNNDIFNMGDNCFETDGGARNIRVFRNRCFNSASGALSVQPVFGGPVYFYQNLIYNTPDRIAEIYRRVSRRSYLQQHDYRRRPGRTCIQRDLPEQSHSGAGRDGSCLRHHDFHELHDIGLQRLSAQPGVNDSFEWNSPPFEVKADFTKNPVTRRFKTLDEYREATGQEKHSVLAGLRRIRESQQTGHDRSAKGI